MRIIQIIFILLFFGLTACHKEDINDLLKTASDSFLEVNSRSSNNNFPNQPDRPGRDLLFPASESMRQNWSHQDYLWVDSAYGDLLWNDAHIEFETPSRDSFLISIPYFKEDSIQAIQFFLKEGGNYYYSHIDANQALSLDSNMIYTSEEFLLWKFINSSFSRHQYFRNSDIDNAFQIKLQELLTWPIVDSRCMHWRIECRGISVSGSGIELCCNYNDCRVVRVPGGCGGGGIPAFPGEPFYGSLNPPGNENSGGGGSTTVDNDAPGTGNNVVGVSGDCITKAEPKLNSLTNEFLSQLNIELPCSNQDIADIMQDVLDENCQEVNTFDFISFRSVKEDFENALEGVETVDPSGLEGCAAYKCAYDLLNNSNNGLFCETIGLFDGNGLHNLNFEYGTYTQAGSEFTDYNSLTRTATIKIDQSQCDKPLLTAAAGILHESIHALLYLKLSEADLDPSDPQSYVNMWEDISFDYYIETYGNDPNGVQHAVMVHDEYWVNKLAEALWNFNGQQFTIDHYKYTAWDGLRIYSHLWSDGTYGENSIFATLHQELMAGQTLTTCE